MLVNEKTKSLAQQIVDFIIENPEKHNQDVFFQETDCGTTMCIAGAAIMIAYGITSGDKLYADPEDIAAPLLGLDSREAARLFYTAENERALNATMAIASGDQDKFYDVLNLWQTLP